MPLPSSMAVLGRCAPAGKPEGDADLFLRRSERYKDRHCAPSQRPVPLVAPLSSCVRWKRWARKGYWSNGMCFVSCAGRRAMVGGRTGMATRQRGGRSVTACVAPRRRARTGMGRDMASRHSHPRVLQLDHLSSARRLHAPPPRSLC